MSTTAARRRAMRVLIAQETITNQAELVEMLEASGFDVTQATVSRDLKAIGAHKTRDRYVLGAQPIADEAHEALARAIDEFAESIIASGQMIVVRTPPGAAQVVAAAIDNAQLSGVLGTVAGDDTVLVVASTAGSARENSELMEKIGALI